MKDALHTMQDHRTLRIVGKLNDGFHAQEFVPMRGAQQIHEHLNR